ncbi:hypothetical protein BN1058_00300 [Paraliobacillus sp. PM-2]|nr:hypothetical protein BN1058_00300 [Paraliobacillus sp. PM-2]
MSKRLFTEKEIKILSKNLYVKSVSEKAITYTEEFKRIFIIENEKGKFPKQIFEDHGFDIDIIGKNVYNPRVKDGVKHIGKMA